MANIRLELDPGARRSTHSKPQKLCKIYFYQWMNLQSEKSAKETTFEQKYQIDYFGLNIAKITNAYIERNIYKSIHKLCPNIALIIIFVCTVLVFGKFSRF